MHLCRCKSSIQKVEILLCSRSVFVLLFFSPIFSVIYYVNNLKKQLFIDLHFYILASHHSCMNMIYWLHDIYNIQYLMVENTQLILSMAHIFSRTNCIQSQLLLTIFHTINSLKFHQMSKLSVLLATSDWICHFHGRILSGRCAYNVSMQFLVEFKGNRKKINSWSFVLITKYIKLKLNLSTQKFRPPSDTQ